jgi:hypothetical protein
MAKEKKSKHELQRMIVGKFKNIRAAKDLSRSPSTESMMQLWPLEKVAVQPLPIGQQAWTSGREAAHSWRGSVY